MSFKNTLPHRVEHGGILVLFSLFLGVFMGLLALAIDIYFALQTRLDQQNVGEYLSLTALNGFYDESIVDENDFVERRTKSLEILQSLDSANSLLGAGAINWGFSTSSSCSGATCSGNGWTLRFGQWNGGSLSQPAPVDPGDPESIDPSLIDGVEMSLRLPTGTSMIGMLMPGSSYNGLAITSISYTFVESGYYRRYRLAKMTASGNAS